LQLALEEDERLAAGYRLLQRFRRLITRRGIRDLDVWLDDALASELAPFVSLAHGIQADRAAVNAGLTLPWSTGPVEGACDTRQIVQASRLRTSENWIAPAPNRQRRLIAVAPRAIRSRTDLVHRNRGRAIFSSALTGV
jgi:hypothetical protein